MKSLLVSLLIGAAGFSAAAADRPNIVFILVDDMGYADVGAMGSTDILTPNVDRLAAEGVKLSDFYANAPVCSPTRCGFITGRWQQRVGFEWALGYTAEQEKLVDGVWTKPTDMHRAIGLPADQPGIAKMLKAAGYATGAFGKWHLGYSDEYNPLHHGFDEYFGELLGHADYYRHIYYDGTYALREGLEISKEKGYITDLINQHAAAFIRKHAAAGEPFFCYVPHLAVHAPFQPPNRPDPKVTKEHMTDGSRADYKAMLEKVDEGIGMFLDELETAGVADNTLIVFSSDNGGERWADNRPLFHHKATLWEGGIRVPCLLRWPAKLPKGKVSPQMAITMDLSATFAAVAGAEPPAGYVLDGVNLIPMLSGEKPEVTDRSFFWRIQRSNRKMRAVRHGKWKYLDDGGTMDLLFDLENDIGERRNLNFTHPDIVADLKKRLAEWETEMAREPKTFFVR
ncbi:MAG: sulfatase-like hydrolase/transferase [Verrucomicrobiae bacterium]|nr:sulfatase-like hydrolase/transferase [Verrucomicrobiae bacterium]MCP5541984.1 sulfatase-like hydrolase/transferase [Akkermansiaceae bacterium]